MAKKTSKGKGTAPRAPAKVYGYARVSTMEQAGGESLEVQKRKIEGRALELGHPLDQVFIEPGVSGWKPLEQRPQGKALLRTVQKAEPEQSFMQYVEYLAANGYVPPNGRGWVDHIRKKGNEANHDIVLMTPADSRDLIGFAEMLLKFIYEFPARVPGTTSSPSRSAWSSPGRSITNSAGGAVPVFCPASRQRMDERNSGQKVAENACGTKVHLGEPLRGA